MRILHLTDVHLDHLETTMRPYVNEKGQVYSDPTRAFCDYYNRRIKNDEIDCIILTGDISVSVHLQKHLNYLDANLKCPVYFILGNHDYYGDEAIFGGNSMQFAETFNGPVLQYLTKYQDLVVDREDDKNHRIAILGTDGWFDGKYASMAESDLSMSDFFCIKEHKDIFTAAVNEAFDNKKFIPKVGESPMVSYQHQFGIPEQLIQQFQKNAERFANILKLQIECAVKDNADTFVIGTHYAPYIKNSVYRGRISDKHWLPYFSCKSVGDVIIDAAETYVNKQFVVLCGHSHGEATNQVLPNLVCHTTEAKYREIYAGRIVVV